MEIIFKLTRGRVVGILKGKNFLKLLDFTGEEVNYLLELSAEVKGKSPGDI